MASVAAAQQLKSLRVVYGGDACNLILYEGADSPALVHALSSRFRLGNALFHLTREDDDGIVPLTSALPSGLTVVLHTDASAASNGNTTSAVNVAPRGMVPGVCPAVTLTLPSGEQRACGSESTAPLLDAGSPAERGWDARASRQHDDAHESEMVLPAGQLPNTSSNISQVNFDVSAAAFQHMEDAAQTLDRHSRMSTELANERTMLAWIRTGLAALRTTFSFFEVTAVVSWWQGSVIGSQVAMMTVVLVATMSGTIRYNIVKEILKRPDIPQDFGRISVKWFNYLVAIAVLATAAGIYTRSWKKEHESGTPA